MWCLIVEYEEINYILVLIKEYFVLLLPAIFTVLFFILIIKLIFLICDCIIYKKAGRKGYEAFIPIYNLIVKLKFLDLPLWIIIFYFIPGLNLIVNIVINIKLALFFDKDELFGIGLTFIPIIFKPILAFSKCNKINYCSNCGAKVSGKFCQNCGFNLHNLT